MNACKKKKIQTQCPYKFRAINLILHLLKCGSSAVIRFFLLTCWREIRSMQKTQSYLNMNGALVCPRACIFYTHAINSVASSQIKTGPVWLHVQASTWPQLMSRTVAAVVCYWKHVRQLERVPIMLFPCHIEICNCQYLLAVKWKHIPNIRKTARLADETQTASVTWFALKEAKLKKTKTSTRS